MAKPQIRMSFPEFKTIEDIYSYTDEKRKLALMGEVFEDGLVNATEFKGFVDYLLRVGIITAEEFGAMDNARDIMNGDFLDRYIRPDLNLIDFVLAGGSLSDIFRHGYVHDKSDFDLFPKHFADLKEMYEKMQKRPSMFLDHHVYGGMIPENYSITGTERAWTIKTGSNSSL